MKRTLSYILTLMLLFSFPKGIVTVSAEDNVKFVLSGFDLIDTDNEGAVVTRGEFAGIVARLIGYSEGDLREVKTAYYDVASGYEYAAEIEHLSQIGLFNGISPNMFGPFLPITYEQAIKVLVVLIGYDDIAQEAGGWSNGYVNTAIRNKMLEGVTREPFHRDSLYKLVYNTLDVEIRETIVSTDSDITTIKAGETLMDSLIYAKDSNIYKHRGVIIADAFTYTTSPYASLADDEVIIENKTIGKTIIYKVGNVRVSDYIGCEVDFFAKETASGYILLSLKHSVNNEIIRIDDEDFNAKTEYSILYTNENNKHDKLMLDTDFKLVYNSSRIVSPSEDDFIVEDGYLEFIDNDGDNLFDIVMVWEYQNAVAVSFDGQRFNFSPEATYEKQPSLFVDTSKKEIKMNVTDNEGNLVEDFNEERVISIFRNIASTRYIIKVSDQTVDGRLDALEDETVYIDGKAYKLAASFGSDFVLGQQIRAKLDYSGKLAFFEETSEKNYGYIFAYGTEGGVNKEYKVKMILPDKVDAGVETNEEDVTDTSSVPYLILHNQDVRVFSLAESVKCGSKKYARSEQEDMLSRSDVKAVKYFLDAEGKIKELVPLEQHGGDLLKRYEYDVYNKVFGGTSVDQSSGFALNSNTMGVCIPVDQDGNKRLDATDDDFDVKVNITVANNETGYRVAGFDYDEKTKKVGMVVHFASMDATLEGSVNQYSGRCSMVKNVKFITDKETGETFQQVEILSGATTETLIAIPSANSQIARLKKGDIITYSKNSNGLLSNAYIIQSIPKLTHYQEVENTSNGYMYLFGKTGNIDYDLVDTAQKRIYTSLIVNAGYGDIEMIIPYINTPPIYIYNREDKSIESANYQEIRPNGDDVFVFKPKGSANLRVIVIVR